MLVVPSNVQGEVDDLIRRFGTPIVQPIALGTKTRWDRRARMYEVCMVVRRPTGRLLTVTKTFYPPGLYRLLTGGVEPGERVLDALVREVDEETGLDVSIRRFLAIIAYDAEDVVDAPPQAFTFAFLLDERGGTLAARDAGERLAAYSDVAPEDLPSLADQLDRLPNEDAPELDDNWREWGRFRAVVHRVVGDALVRG